MVYDNYLVKWELANKYELVFVILHQKTFRLTYVTELLKSLRKAFIAKYKGALEEMMRGGPIVDCTAFTGKYAALREEAENIADAQRKGGAAARVTAKAEAKASRLAAAAESAAEDADGGDASSAADGGAPLSKEARLKQLAARGAGGRGKGKAMRGYSPKAGKGKGKDEGKGKKPKKVGRKWDGTSKEDDEEFHKYTTIEGEETKHEQRDESFFVSTTPDSVNNIFVPDGESDDELDEEDEASGGEEDEASGKKRGGFFGFVRKYVGNRELDDGDLDEMLPSFKSMLQTKNVGQEVADKVCDSVRNTLRGKKLQTLQNMKSVVKEAMSSALTRILTPKRSINLLRDVMENKKRGNGRPYVAVFIGVNGVGKSTSLSKIAFMLQQQGHSVMIAACDTFRSGAVEQLRVHTNNLGLELYHQGYGKDAAAIASAAIKHAESMGIDVVLVDTTGRMQDNKPLMTALAKLVSVNQPDLVLFVGEALVGNDAVDQLTKFNQALADYSTLRVPRLIDGIILTKFDTVDDKVGAAVSMVYTVGVPVLYCGTGQSYSDLRELNVTAVIRALLA